jgi:hypothetical protein
MKTIFAIAACAGVLLASDSGIRPRPAADYAAHTTSAGITVAASVIPPSQVSKLFATDLNRSGYLVVEVAIYPGSAGEADVASRDFLLRAGRDPATVRPVSPQTIAAAVHRKYNPPPRKPGDVTVYPTGTVGYETGGYDPVTGRHGGVYGGGGVGVAVGNGGSAPPRPASTATDRSTMEQELTDKSLPEGHAIQAVAGYLYFPKPESAKKAGGFTLTYYAPTGQVKLVIPAPGK